MMDVCPRCNNVGTFSGQFGDTRPCPICNGVTNVLFASHIEGVDRGSELVVEVAKLQAEKQRLSTLLIVALVKIGKLEFERDFTIGELVAYQEDT